MEWNIWRWCELRKYKFLNEDMIVACTQNIKPHVCDCLLFLPFSVRECSKFWANQPAVFVAISCRLRPAQENACSRDYLFFFFLHSWLVEKLQREFQSNHKASFCSWYEARENACSRDYPLLFSLLIGWEVRAWILIQWQSYFLLPAQNACSRDYPFFYLQPWLVEKLEREFLTNHKA